MWVWILIVCLVAGLLYAFVAWVLRNLDGGDE